MQFGLMMFKTVVWCLYICNYYVELIVNTVDNLTQALQTHPSLSSFLDMLFLEQKQVLIHVHTTLISF